MLKKLLWFLVLPTVAVVGVLAALLVWPLPDMPRPGVAGDFLVRNVAVVDVEAGVVRLPQDIVVRGGRIESIGAAGGPVHASLRVVDGTGRFAIPGLWDMHTHALKISPQYLHPLFIANGITGVREMWGCTPEPDSLVACRDDVASWNRALEDGSGLSPRYILQSSFPFDGSDARETRELATYYAAAGVDSLKTYTNLSPAAYGALAEVADAHGLMLAGHPPLRIPLTDLLAAGQDSIEHPRVFLFACYEDAAAYRALPDPLAAYTTEMRARFIDGHDAARCATLMAAMAEAGTWWTPTLQVLRMSAFAGDQAFRDDPRRRYIPYPFDAWVWAPDADRARASADDASGRQVAGELYRLALRQVGQANAAGVRILAGTDAGDTYVFPGFSLHDELVELGAAGLTPTQALRSATLDAAKFSGLADRFGSIEAGKHADIVLLAANPLSDIRNTREIDGLLIAGRYLDRAALDELLGFAERQAGSLRANLHLVWGALRSPIVHAQFAD